MRKDIARLNLKLLKTDKEALLFFARAQGETMSVIIRRLIKQELEKYENKENQKTMSDEN